LNFEKREYSERWKANLPFFKITENWQGITEKSNFKKPGNFVMDLQKIGILKNNRKFSEHHKKSNIKKQNGENKKRNIRSVGGAATSYI
jgi:hypothetical protein